MAQFIILRPACAARLRLNFCMERIIALVGKSRCYAAVEFSSWRGPWANCFPASGFALAGALCASGMRPFRERAGPDQGYPAGGLVSAARTRRLLQRAGQGLLQGRRTRRHHPARRALRGRGAAGGLGRAQFGMASSDQFSKPSPMASPSSPWPPPCSRSAGHHGAQGFADPFLRRSQWAHRGHQDRVHVVRVFEKRYHLNDVHEIPAMMNVANFVADPHYIQQAFATSEPFFAQKAGIETRVLLTSELDTIPIA